MSHRCPAPKCPEQVPSSMFACRRHWNMLPQGMRAEIFRAYRAEPLSQEHLEAMEAASTWYKENL